MITINEQGREISTPDPTNLIVDPSDTGTSEFTIQAKLTGTRELINPFFFPVLPEDKFGGDFSMSHWYPRIVGIGEIVVPGTENLETIGWESHFPRDYNDSYVVISQQDFSKLPSPKIIAEEFIQTMREKKVMHLVISGTPWNEDVIIEKFKWWVKGGEPGDIYYDILFKRYRTTRLTIVKNIYPANKLPTESTEIITVEPANPEQEPAPDPPTKEIVGPTQDLHKGLIASARRGVYTIFQNYWTLEKVTSIINEVNTIAITPEELKDYNETTKVVLTGSTGQTLTVSMLTIDPYTTLLPVGQKIQIPTFGDKAFTVFPQFIVSE